MTSWIERPCRRSADMATARRQPLCSFAWGSLLVVLVGCQSVPVQPVPAPLPEHLEAWALEDAAAPAGAFLGVRGSENDSGSLDDFFSDPGVRVDSVVENSPAAQARIRPGDILLKLAGRTLEDPRSLQAILERLPTDDRVTLEFRRGDAVASSTIQLTARSSTRSPPDPLFLYEAARVRAGFMTAPEGVRVVSLAPGSPLATAGVKEGDLLLSVDGESLASDRELIRHLSKLPEGARTAFEVLSPGAPASRITPVRLIKVPRRVTKAGLPILFNYAASVDGEHSSFSLLDLWVFQLLQCERTGAETRWVLLELFGFDLIEYGSGQGELQ